MATAEVEEARREAHHFFDLPPGARVFFTDDNSNHAFMYLDDPLCGRAACTTMMNPSE
ncbi:hypothetical protein SAMN00790413_04550 [Deinococcus hopiensis KR-140]|uniref:Uncharacterized protein n=1 Tax=Deinococcus hopiensis KR-140 TaxID=695939 RepID=A0A1W1UJX6_9DEIO|nr:hypothetical protein SAMN00790413_04550 [Deinococcus hopiensis KR-140]